MVKRLLQVSLFLIVFANMLFAQSADTVFVPATNADGSTYYDSMIDYIVADTNAAGQQLHSIYKLNRGQFYVINKAVTLRNPVEIVAEPPVQNDALLAPPKILSNINEDGSTSTHNLLVTFADITLKNLWLGGTDMGAVNHGWGFGQALAIEDSSVTVKLDGIWCDYNGWSAIATAQPHTKWYVNNLHARNEQNEGDQWTTFLFYFENASVIDTFVVTNTSYFQSNSFFIFPPSVVEYLKIDHCTFVNSLKWPFHQTQWLNATFTNNIFYNSGSLGLTTAQAQSQDPHSLMYGIINVDTLVANSPGGVAGPYTIPEADRIVEVKNNLWYYSSEIENYLTVHDTLWRPVFMNERTEAMFANDAVWPGLVAENNWNQDPMFNDFADLSAANTLLAQVCTDIQAGNTHPWDWDGDQLADPEFYRLLIQYPTTENFRSYSGLVGTDGNPLGDLSFYPGGLVSVEKEEEVPQGFSLEQNYPNPFNPSTEIKYQINETGNVRLAIYNILGEQVKLLVSEAMTPGKYSVSWNGRNEAGITVPSGVYFYEIRMGQNAAVKKMMLLK